MISSNTPYKLAEIVQDTWPNLFYLKRTNNQMKFTVYSKDGCPYCTKVEQVLKLAQLQYVVLKLNENFTREEFYSKFGRSCTFPQVLVDDKCIGGCSDTVIYLKEQKLV